MTVDPSTIKPGGKVSVTLTDGTKIIGARVTVGKLTNPSGETTEFPMISFGDIVTRLARVASIDAYTPPTPEWDRPEVFAVVDRDGDRWVRMPDGQWPLNPTRGEADFGPFTVLAVYADGVER